jgi:hypothetical protein
LTCTPEALIDVAAAIGLRWQQEVVQAEAPRCLLLGTSSGELNTLGLLFVDELRTPHAVGMAT